MPPVRPVDVVSFSSEDPHHPASNLLIGENFRKWKCKEPGEKEAFVILKFEKAITITCIDIGNDGSALVEVSVARSGGSGDPQYEVILCSTAFMSPMDSREGKNLNGVKSFSLHSLSKPIAAQKWDLVKILVSQPFNRHVQFGLTFVKFIAAPDPNEPKKIGMFTLRKPIGGDPDEDEDAVKTGNLFASLNKSPKGGSIIKNGSPLQNSSTSKSSTNAAIRETTSKLAAAAKSTSEAKVKTILDKPKVDMPSSSSPARSIKTNLSSATPASSSPLLSRKQLEDESSKKKEKKNDSPKPSKVVPSSGSKTTNSAKSSKKRGLSSEESDDDDASNSPTTSKSPPSKKEKKSKITKPFGKLFEGVVFSMSGFENPTRGQLRDKAIEMGAKYKADWDRTCTHLICAFYNTPKFRTVKSGGNGNIVKKEWIEKSYSDKCRYPWRRFCLDRNDKGTESEDEIYAEVVDCSDEEIINDASEPSPAKREDAKNDSDNEASKTKRKRARVFSSDEESDNESKKAYTADTDVDDDQTPDLSPSLIPEASPFFENIRFFIGSPQGNTKDNTSLIESIIVKHKGKVDQSLTEETDYYVCHGLDWSDNYTDALSDNPNLTFIQNTWIFQCDEEDALVDKNSFILSPG